jgi:hypothetical protein
MTLSIMALLTFMLSVVDKPTMLGVVMLSVEAPFTTLHSLLNLWMGPISYSSLGMLSTDKHSSLLGPFIS